MLYKNEQSQGREQVKQNDHPCRNAMGVNLDFAAKWHRLKLYIIYTHAIKSSHAIPPPSVPFLMRVVIDTAMS